jgi:hypothetical protein
MVYDSVKHSCTYNITFKESTAWDESDGPTGTGGEEASSSPKDDGTSAGASIGTGTRDGSQTDRGTKTDGGHLTDEGASGGGQAGNGTPVGNQAKTKTKGNMTYSNFVCRYASCSFGTRTDVFVYDGPKPAPKVRG